MDNGRNTGAIVFRAINIGMCSLQLILDHFMGEKRVELEDAHPQFKQIIARLEEIYQVRYSSDSEGEVAGAV